jgi:hypothetical protein
MIRLLQNFDKLVIDMDAQPQRSTSLLEWKTKRREVERDLLTVHLTLSTKVSLGPYVPRPPSHALTTGRRMGPDERCIPFLMRLGSKLHEWRSVLIYMAVCVERSSVCTETHGHIV